MAHRFPHLPFDARVLGAGRAGGSLANALAAAGWRVDGPWDRALVHARAADATSDAALVVIAVPDGNVAAVASAIAPGEAVVAHVAGSLGLDVLNPHADVASMHPLVSLPNAAVGAERLRGAHVAVVSATERARTVIMAAVDALDARPIAVADADRVRYHAAAAIAANHLVALLGQVERIAADIDVPLEAYLDLARGAIDNVAAVGPRSALTGPVAREDWATVARHLDAIDASERPAYRALADAAARLVGTRIPSAEVPV